MRKMTDVALRAFLFTGFAASTQDVWATPPSIPIPTSMTSAPAARPVLGLRVVAVDAQLATSLGIDPASAMMVAALTEDGPGHRAGIQQGDIITAIDGKKVSAITCCSEQLSARTPGEAVPVAVISASKNRRTLSVVLGSSAELSPPLNTGTVSNSANAVSAAAQQESSTKSEDRLKLMSRWGIYAELAGKTLIYGSNVKKFYWITPGEELAIYEHTLSDGGAGNEYRLRWIEGIGAVSESRSIRLHKGHMVLWSRGNWAERIESDASGYFRTALLSPAKKFTSKGPIPDFVETPTINRLKVITSQKEFDSFAARIEAERLRREEKIKEEKEARRSSGGGLLKVMQGAVAGVYGTAAGGGTGLESAIASAVIGAVGSAAGADTETVYNSMAQSTAEEKARQDDLRRRGEEAIAEGVRQGEILRAEREQRERELARQEREPSAAASQGTQMADASQAQAQQQEAQQRRQAEADATRAAEQRKADDARRAAEAKKAEAAKVAEAKRKAAEEERNRPVTWREAVAVCEETGPRSWLCKGPRDSSGAYSSLQGNLNQVCPNGRNLGSQGRYRIYGCGYGINPEDNSPFYEGHHYDWIKALGLVQPPERRTYRCKLQFEYCRSQ